MITVAAGAREGRPGTAMTTYNAYGQLTVDEQLEIIDGIGDTDAELHEVPLEAILAEITRRSGK